LLKPTDQKPADQMAQQMAVPSLLFIQMSQEVVHYFID
jgi:hypothetical protein